MGLKISTFKKGGQTFTDAYAKVSSVRYDNDSKVASYGIKIFVSKADKNLITEIQNQWCKIVAGTDMVTQCYTKINTIIDQQKAQIAKLIADNLLIVDNDNLKLRNESTIIHLQDNELLQLTDSVEF
jgi:hypothetical protein